MYFSKNGGETNSVVAELRMRIDQTTEEVARIASDKVRVDNMQAALLSKTKDISNTTKTTDKRLSYIMGSFMNKVEHQMSTVKRENGEAAHELKGRFTKELRHSMQRVTTKLTNLESDVRMIHPLVNTWDVASVGSTSLVLASRCMSCDRPVVGVSGATGTSGSTGRRRDGGGSEVLPQSFKGALQGSLLLSPSSAPRSSETRGGGFRVGSGVMAPGAGMLWVGGQTSPTGTVRAAQGRPRSSMGFREKRY